MSLRHGILGFLSQSPETSGYDLKKEFDTFMSTFWFTHLSQIYPELNKLEKEEFIVSELIAQTGKPDKKVYSITEKGMQELISWLSTPPDDPKIKEPFLMQTFFMDNIPFTEVVFLLRSYQKKRQQRLELMSNLVKQRFENYREQNVAFTARMLMGTAVYKKGIEQEIHYVKWCEDTIRLLESFQGLWESKDQEEEGVASIPFLDMEEELVAFYEGVLEPAKNE